MKKEVSVTPFSDMIRLFVDMRNTNLAPLIDHAVDVAKISALILKRIKPFENPSHIYITGLFHDIGLVIYSEILAPEDIAKLSEDSSYTLSSLLYKIDRDMYHAAFSARMMEKVGIVPQKYLEALRQHHNPLNKMTGSDDVILISSILDVADNMSVIIRDMKSDMVKIAETIDRFLINHKMVDEVRRAARDLFKSYVEMTYVFDNDSMLDDFCEASIHVSLEQFIETLKILVLMVDLQSPFTVKHSSSIAALARDIAAEMFKNKFDSLVMYIAGLIHDIGKLLTPVEILHKPGRLSKSERYVMNFHVSNTFKLLSKYSNLDEFAAIASLHHERLDGSGYPWGLKGNEIGMRARILQVADVFTALTEDRPYRRSMSSDEALKIIEDEVDKGRLDGDVYSVLREMIRNGYRISKNDIVFTEFFGDMNEYDIVRKVLSYVS